MEGKTSTQPTDDEGLFSECSDYEEWDTDLEECGDTTRPNNFPMEQVYLTACTELGISPVSTFIKQMTSTKVLIPGAAVYTLKTLT